MRTSDLAAADERRTRPSYLSLALVLAAVLVTACASATPTTRAAPEPSSPGAAASGGSSAAARSPTSFASQLYGYGLLLPAGWEAQPADSPWLSGTVEGSCPSDWDCFSEPSGQQSLTAAAETLRGRLTLDQWRLQVEAGIPGGCVDSAQTTPTTLGGEPGQTWTTTCAAEGVHSTKVIAFHGGRGYILLFVSPISTGLDADRSAMSAILATLRFIPS